MLGDTETRGCLACVPSDGRRGGTFAEDVRPSPPRRVGRCAPRTCGIGNRKGGGVRGAAAIPVRRTSVEFTRGDEFGLGCEFTNQHSLLVPNFFVEVALHRMDSFFELDRRRSINRTIMCADKVTHTPDLIFIFELGSLELEAIEVRHRGQSHRGVALGYRKDERIKQEED